MIFFVAFVCFALLLGSVFMNGSIMIQAKPYLSVEYSYMELIAILSIFVLGILVFVQMLRKLVLVPLGWLDSYKQSRQKKMSMKALQEYVLLLSKQNNDFGSYSKVLYDNVFYWISAFMSNDKELKLKSAQFLSKYPNGDFFQLHYKVNLFLEEQQYENALLLLENADHFAHKSSWFWIQLFTCYLHLKQFDKAESVLKPLRSLVTDIRQYEVELYLSMANDNIDKLENLELCYKIDNNNIQVANLLIQELINVRQIDEAKKILLAIWKHSPSLLLLKNIEAIYKDMVPVERFSAVSELVKKNPKHYISEYLNAIYALDAGLFLIARESLMKLGQTHPELAFPMLAELEKIEKHDLEESNRWLEKSVEIFMNKCHE